MIPLTQALLNISLFNGQQAFYLILVMVGLLAFSAFFSASETGFSTTSPLKIRKLADDNVKGARKAMQVIDNYDKTLSIILVGNNLVNIANTTIAAFIFSMLIMNPTISNIANTVIMTIVILIFAEILPKSIAKLNPEKIALRFAGPFLVVSKFVFPITYPFIVLQRVVLKRVKSNGTSSPTVTKDDLESIIDTMEEEGVIKSEDADLYLSVMDINEKTVYDIMTPRVDVVAVNITDTIDEVTQAFLENGYSRLPVYENDKDHMIGILNYKDYFKELIVNKNIDLKDLTAQTTFVAENMTVKELIRIMQKEKRHLAIVLDENGGTSGVVTMEDALEEVVGEIYDEHDGAETVELFKKLQDNVYEVDAKMELEDLFEELEIENLPETEYTSVGGYLYELSANLPEINQIVEVVVDDEQPNELGEYITKKVRLSFVISEMDEKRIKKVTLLTETLSDRAEANLIQDENN